MKPFSLKEYLKNPSRKVITREGKSVKIYCTNHVDEYPVIAEIEGTGHSYAFNKDGKYLLGSESENDLCFAPEKREGWVNLYLDTNTDSYSPGACIYESEKSAEKEGKTCKNYITTAKIEWEE